MNNAGLEADAVDFDSGAAFPECLSVEDDIVNGRLWGGRKRQLKW